VIRLSVSRILSRVHHRGDCQKVSYYSVFSILERCVQVARSLWGVHCPGTQFELPSRDNVTIRNSALVVTRVSGVTISVVKSALALPLYHVLVNLNRVS
jgi:hypothetical protein